jgi:hypothetical protein
MTVGALEADAAHAMTVFVAEGPSPVCRWPLRFVLQAGEKMESALMIATVGEAG